jgi:hypothetical protein
MFDIGLKIDSSSDNNVPELQDLTYNMTLVDLTDDDSVESTSDFCWNIVDEVNDDGSFDKDAVSLEDYTPPLPPKRISFSARESPMALQTTGIRQIEDDVSTKKIVSQPTIFGFNYHYIFRHVWGATSPIHHRRVGSSSTPVGSNAITCCRITFKQVFKITEKKKGNPGKVNGLDLKKYTYTVRSKDKAVWPKSNEKKVVSRKSASQMMTSRPIVNWLREDGLIPIVRLPLKKDRTV